MRSSWKTTIALDVVAPIFHAGNSSRGLNETNGLGENLIFR